MAANVSASIAFRSALAAFLAAVGSRPSSTSCRAWAAALRAADSNVAEAQLACLAAEPEPDGERFEAARLHNRIEATCAWIRNFARLIPRALNV